MQAIPFPLISLGHVRGIEKLYPQWGHTSTLIDSPQLKQKF